jgi:hypothetical protein
MTFVMYYVKLRLEQIDDLIVLVGLDRFLECYKNRLGIRETIDENRPTLCPCSAPSPQVQHSDAHATNARQATSRYTGN